MVLVNEDINRSVRKDTEPRNKPREYNQLKFDKRANTTEWRKDSVFTNGARQQNIHIQKVNLDPDLAPSQK